jgi:hypothetical protein
MADQREVCVADLSTLPRELQALLKPARNPSEFTVPSWEPWMTRKLARFVQARVQAGGGDTFSTTILGVRHSHAGEPSLIVSSFYPEPKKEFWETARAVILRFGFVQGGHAIITSVNANAKREIVYKDTPGVELGDVLAPRVKVSPYALELGHRSPVKLRIEAQARSVSLLPDSVSPEEIRFVEKLPFIVTRQGLKAEGLLKLDEESDPLPVKVRLEHHKQGGYAARIEEISPAAKKALIGFIDDGWVSKARVRKRRAREEREREHETMTTDLDSLLKPHDFLLSPDEGWRTKLANLDIKVRQIAEPDIDYVMERVTTERCDVILADADLWGKLAPELGRALHFDLDSRKLPLIWFADEDNWFREQFPRALVGLGAYDLVDRGLSKEELALRLGWATKRNTLGEGDIPIALLSPSRRMQYRMGLALRRKDLTIHKAMEMRNPLASLNEIRPQWIVVDGVSIGDAYDSILEACLNWRDKHRKCKGIFLMARFPDPEKVPKWKEKGLTDVLIYDHDVEELARRVFYRLT